MTYYIKYNTQQNDINFNIIMKYLKSILRVISLAYKKIIAFPKHYAIPLLAFLFLVRTYLNSKTISTISRVSLSDFLKSLQSGQVINVLIKDNYLFFSNKVNSLFKVNYSMFPKNKLFDKLIQAKVHFQSASKLSLGTIIKIFTLSAFITFVVMRLFFDKQDSIKTTSNPIKKIKFQDVVGLNSSKVALRQVIDYMKNPSQFKQIGARMRKGIILYGPSGTGKTTIAKACAGQANVPFYSCNASQFCEMYVGMGPKKVRELFKKAKQNSPSIVYIDEIDAMGNRKSSLGYTDGASTQKNSTINQLLSEMDGFASSDQILVIGSTNRIQMLDSSLLRPGRFDLKIQIPLPDLNDRVQIILHHLKNKNNKLTKQYLTKIAQKLKGWSGADLQNLTNQSVYTALRRGSQQITEHDIQQTLKFLV